MQLFRRASDLSDSADPIGIVPFIVKKFGVVLYHLPWAFLTLKIRTYRLSIASYFSVPKSV
jgi:hypothetical protein